MFTKMTICSVLLATVPLGALTGNATAGSFTRGCAARDIQVMKLLDEREIGDAVSTRKLKDAILAIMNARMVCHQGRVRDALALYDEVSRSMTTNSARFGLGNGLSSGVPPDVIE